MRERLPVGVLLLVMAAVVITAAMRMRWGLLDLLLLVTGGLLAGAGVLALLPPLPRSPR